MQLAAGVCLETASLSCVGIIPLQPPVDAQRLGVQVGWDHSPSEGSRQRLQAA